MEIIMTDILELLNIKVSYNQRLSQINEILNQTETNYPELNLTIVSSSLNYNQKNYIITPTGIKNSKRDAKDGIVLFGYERKNKICDSNLNTDNKEDNNLNTETIHNLEESEDFLFNDFVFPLEEKEENYGLYEFPNFAIYFDTNDKNYYIKDFNTGVGALMKIKKYTIEGSTLINIGSNYIVVNIEKNKIILKIFNNTILENKSSNENNRKNCDIKEFKIENNKKTKITLGRSKKCNIVIDDVMLSKKHTCIEYNPKDKKFYLYDGDSKNESTNGTWVFILNPIKITNNFMFKAEHTLFVANLTNSS